MIHRIITILLILNSSFFAQDLLSKIQEKFDEVISFESDFTQSVILESGESQGVLSGKFYFKKENSYRINIATRIIVSDGKSIWNYDKTNDKVITLAVEDDPLALSLPNYIFKYPEFCEIEIVDEYSLILIPDPDELDLDKVQIWTDKDYLINKIKVRDFNGNEYIFNLTSVQMKEIPDSYFTFIPSEGTEVIDLR